MTRLKNRIQSVLHANLIPREAGNLFTKKGRARLEQLAVPADQKRLLLRHLDELDRLGAELLVIDKHLAQRALDQPNVRRLMTIGGVNSIVAASVLAAIGDITRFSSPEKLVSYLGLNPSVHQSGDHPAFHGHIAKQGRGRARAMLVESGGAHAAVGLRFHRPPTLRPWPSAAFKRNERYIVQRYIRGADITIGVLNGQTGAPLHIVFRTVRCIP
jgi:transposase